MGQARAFYHFGLRGIFDGTASNRAMELLANNAITENIRLEAAHYFGRFKEAVTPELSDRLLNHYSIEDNPDIRMPLASAVRGWQLLALIKNYFNTFLQNKIIG